MTKSNCKKGLKHQGVFARESPSQLWSHSPTRISELVVTPGDQENGWTEDDPAPLNVRDSNINNEMDLVVKKETTAKDGSDAVSNEGE